MHFCTHILCKHACAIPSVLRDTWLRHNSSSGDGLIQEADGGPAFTARASLFILSPWNQEQAPPAQPPGRPSWTAGAGSLPSDACPGLKASMVGVAEP